MGRCGLQTLLDTCRCCFNSSGELPTKLVDVGLLPVSRLMSNSCNVTPLTGRTGGTAATVEEAVRYVATADEAADEEPEPELSFCEGVGANSACCVL